MGYLFTSESVSEGHPDKIADQISDGILDEFLRRDPECKVACETLTTTGLVVISGEVRAEAYVDVQDVARRIHGNETLEDAVMGGNALHAVAHQCGAGGAPAAQIRAQLRNGRKCRRQVVASHAVTSLSVSRVPSTSG